MRYSPCCSQGGGCYSTATDDDLISPETRISSYPETISVSNEATSQDAIITLNPKARSAMGWSFSLDASGEWIRAEKVRTLGESTGTIYENAVRLYFADNNAYTRRATLTITADDGSTLEIPVSQTGILADASVSVSPESLTFLADSPEVQTLTVTSNMDEIDVVSDSDWCTITESGDGIFTVSCESYDDKTQERIAILTVHVGSAETSEAETTVTVTQLRMDVYCYLYGSATPKFATQSGASQMSKVSEGIYADSVYVKNGRIAVYTTDDQAYYLAPEGTLSETATDLTVDVAGLRSIRLDLSAKSYTMERISTQNAMPDGELTSYKTKAYIARSGIKKLWMVEHMRWDGGDISPKLGSAMVPAAAAATGGYANDAVLPQRWDDQAKLISNYETTEIGGTLVGESIYGRIYCFSEILTGEPRYGIDNKINQTFPAGWTAGSTIVDGIGNEVKLEYIVSPGAFTGNNTTDEASYPMLTMQVQGICPYGWHIANASDWIDLLYAMSQASGSSEKYPVDVSQCTYKQYTTASGSATVGNPISPRGVGNSACWYRNTTYWTGGNIADGADEFGFNLYPLGFRYLKQGYQMAGLRCQMWVPLYYSEARAYRINVVINNHTHTYNEMTYVDNGNAILPFRCVKNYENY